VRRQALLDVGLMDAWHFPRPQIEDIELGRRLRRAGHRVELRGDILCTHLKRWTLRSMLITDFRDRGAPWMQLLLAEGGASPATLNLRASEKVCTILAGVVAAALLASAVFRSLLPLAVAALAALVVVALNRDFYRLLLRTQGLGPAAAALPLHLIFYFTGGLAGVTGAAMHYAGRRPTPPARALTGAATWPPAPDRPAGSIWTLDAAAEPRLAVAVTDRGAEPQ
jgi:hypothetical protein